MRRGHRITKATTKGQEAEVCARVRATSRTPERRAGLRDLADHWAPFDSRKWAIRSALHITRAGARAGGRGGGGTASEKNIYKPQRRRRRRASGHQGDRGKAPVTAVTAERPRCSRRRPRPRGVRRGAFAPSNPCRGMDCDGIDRVRAPRPAVARPAPVGPSEPEGPGLAFGGQTPTGHRTVCARPRAVTRGGYGGKNRPGRVCSRSAAS